MHTGICQIYEPKQKKLTAAQVEFFSEIIKPSHVHERSVLRFNRCIFNKHNTIRSSEGCLWRCRVVGILEDSDFIVEAAEGLLESLRAIPIATVQQHQLLKHLLPNKSFPETFGPDIYILHLKEAF